MREPLPNGQGICVFYRLQDEGTTKEGRGYYVFAEKPGTPWVKKSLVQLHRELLAQADEGLLGRLFQRLRLPLERRYGWEDYYAAYNQFVEEHGARFDRFYEDLVYLPGPTPQSIRIKGYLGREYAPERVVDKFTARTDLVWSERVVNDDDTFSVVLSLPSPQ